MNDARDLLRTLAAEDRQGAVFCAALCAASVAHLLPRGERRPWRAVRLAMAWGCGIEMPRERLEEAAEAAGAADAGDDDAPAEAADYAAYAAEAAAYAAAGAAVGAAADAAADAAAAAWEQARDAHLARLHALVLHQTTPVVPTPTDVHRAAPGAQVAWDRLIERRPNPVRIGTLGDALARARKARLRWTCPVERALVERCEIAELIELWGGRRG